MKKILKEKKSRPVADVYMLNIVGHWLPKWAPRTLIEIIIILIRANSASQKQP